VEQIPNTEAQY